MLDTGLFCWAGLFLLAALPGYFLLLSGCPLAQPTMARAWLMTFCFLMASPGVPEASCSGQGRLSMQKAQWLKPLGSTSISPNP